MDTPRLTGPPQAVLLRPTGVKPRTTFAVKSISKEIPT